MSDANKQRDTAEADVASIEPGDSPSDVESKVLGLNHLSGDPTEAAKDSREAEDS